MRQTAYWMAAVAGMLGPASAWASSVARLDLGEPAYVGIEAQVPVELVFNGEDGDVLTVFDLSTTDSDDSLAGRMSFRPGPAMAGWTQLDPLADDGAGSFEATLGEPGQRLGPGWHRLGTLHVSLLGLPIGSVHALAVDGPPWPTRFVGTHGLSGELMILDGESGGLGFGSPEGVDVTVPNLAIPEPLSLSGVLAAVVASASYARRRRG